MTPKTYLLSLGIILIAVSVLSIFHIDGPTPADSIFGAAWLFNIVENIGHTLVGIVSIWAAYAASIRWQRRLCFIGGVAGIAVGLYSLIISQMLFGAHFENPADTIFHIIIGIAGFVAYRYQSRAFEKKITL